LGARNRALFFASDAKEHRIVVASPLRIPWATLESLGDNIGLTAACFHGHWQLCRFLVEQGADVNRPEAETGETPLHNALCKTDRLRYNLVLRVLLALGANANCATKSGIETGEFMRDCRTKGETPLHRAAAFGDEEEIQMLLDAGAKIDATDAHGDSPLSWASWYLRPIPILRKLLYRDFCIHTDYGRRTYLASRICKG
jgi:hypothetical protein